MNTLELFDPGPCHVAAGHQPGWECSWRICHEIYRQCGLISGHPSYTGNAVTASVDRINFYNPVYLGNILTLKASLNLGGRTSMEVGVRVEAEKPYTGEISHTVSAYLTIMAFDENGRPKEVPGLIIETEEEHRRNRAAKARRIARMEEKRKEETYRQDIGACEL